MLNVGRTSILDSLLMTGAACEHTSAVLTKMPGQGCLTDGVDEYLHLFGYDLELLVLIITKPAYLPVVGVEADTRPFARMSHL